MTAELLLFTELSPYRARAYECAVSRARGLVPFVRSVRREQWALVDMIVAINISLVARFLHKEAARLRALGQVQPAAMAESDADALARVLQVDFGHWIPMAALHSLIVDRVKQGLPEKEGEYERV